MFTIVDRGEARQLPVAVGPVSLSEPPALPVKEPLSALSVALAPPVLPATHTGHVRQTDDAMTNAKASRYYSHEISLVAGGAITAILFLAWWTRGGDIGIYFGLEVLGVATVTLVSLIANRGQGLKYSAAGVAHHELRTQDRLARVHAGVQKYQIDSQERLAMYAIDRHADLIEQRWRLEVGDEAGQGDRGPVIDA